MKKPYFPVVFDAIIPGKPPEAETPITPASPKTFAKPDCPAICKEKPLPVPAPVPVVDSALPVVQQIHKIIHPAEPAPTEVPVLPQKEPSTKPYDVAQTFLARVHVRLVDNTIYIYNGRVYGLMTAERVNRVIMEVCRSAVQSAGTATIVRQIQELVQMEPRLVVKGEASRRYLSFQNGLLDLQSRLLQAHTPYVFSTAQVDAPYLLQFAGQHPRFSQFLRSVSRGDLLLEQRIWQMMGYALTPDTSAKAFFVLQGLPNSGKSVLGELLARCLPDEAVTSLNMEALGSHFGPGELVGKQLCTAMDLSAAPWDSAAVGILKTATGNDLLSADIKYQPRIKFRNTATFIFGTNHAVVLANRDEAFCNRMVVIPFRYSVPPEHQERDLLDALLLERTAIVASAMQAYFNLRRNNYRFAGDFAANEVIAQPSDVPMVSLDQAVADFFYRRCVLDADAVTFTEDLYQGFSSEHPGLALLPVFSTKLLTFLTDAYPGIVTKGRRRRNGSPNPTSALAGIRLRD